MAFYITDMHFNLVYKYFSSPVYNIPFQKAA